MNQSQFKSKCCDARVYSDYSYENDASEGPKWRCARCGKVVEEVTISRRAKRLR